MQLAFLLLSLALTDPDGTDRAESIDVPELQPWSERSHCPSLGMLNAASRHYHSGNVERAFIDDSYAERRKAAGLPPLVDREKVRQLQNSRDHHACERLNQWFEANVLYDADYVFDAQRDEYLPYGYPMYYRIRNRYAILFSPYNAGRFEAELPPLPIPGHSRVYVFDSSFRKIGEFSH